LAACLTFLGDTGAADGARYTKSETKVEATKTEATKVKKPDSKKQPERRRPILDVNQFRMAVAAKKVEKLTEEAIRKLKQLISITEDSEVEKADYYFRLAEHYRDQHNWFEFKARELDEKIYQASDEQKGSLRTQQGGYEKQSRDWMVQSIKLYVAIAQNKVWSKYTRMDEVLFNVADMLTQAKRQDRAREFFRQLIRNYPQSKYIPDAYLSFAEYYFNVGEVTKALRLYEAVGKYPDSPIYGYSIYKQGWCWLNLKNPRRALELFIEVITKSAKWGGSKRGKIVLVKEAQKDSVRAFALFGTPDQAWNLFKRIGGSYAPVMLERLAEIYYDQGKFDNSIRIFKKLIALDPRSKKLCNWQYAIVRSTLSGKPKAAQVQEARRLADVYSAVKGRAGATSQAKAECRENAAAVLRELATTWHNEAQKTQNESTYALAELLYKEYLQNFPQEKDAYQMNFYYAELLFKLKRWDQAAKAYTQVVKMLPKGKYLQEAAYAAVISWKNALNVSEETEDTAKQKGNKLKERPISDREKQMIAAFQTYLQYVPQSKERVNIMYREARIYYENNHFSRAAAGFIRVVKEYPTNSLAVYSANLLLDCLGVLKKYDELERWIDRFLAHRQLLATAERVQSDFKGGIELIKGRIERKRVEQMEQEKRWRECGEGYARLANKYQDDKKWSELLFNAAICFEAAKLIGQAIYVRSTLIKIKPNDRLAQKALYMIGQNYHALAWYSRAAHFYEEFARKFPGEKEAPTALQNAIVFRLGRGEQGKAAADVSLFVKNYGRRPKFAAKTAAVYFSMGSAFVEKKDAGAVTKHYNSYLSSWGKHGGLDRQILAHVTIGQQLWRASCPVAGVNGACIKVTRVRSKRKIVKRGKKKKRTVELRTQCGPETKMKVQVLKRNRQRGAQAQSNFKKALVLAKKARAAQIRGENEDERQRRTLAMRSAIASAQFHEAEATFEEFLEVKFPPGLDFNPKNKAAYAKSQKALAKYMGTKAKLLGKARKAYQDVIKSKVAHWAIAATARVGQLFQNFADALYTAAVPKPPIPKVLRTREQKEEFTMMFTDAYCDRLENEAAPLEKKAVEGLDTCLKKSTELSWYNEWSRLCERELNQIKPAEYPLASEIRANPGYVFLRADRVSVVEEVK
jgi:TolA-binding protein